MHKLNAYNGNTLRRGTLVAALLLGSAVAPTGFAATDTATTTGTVVTPITIAMATNLNFGEFAAHTANPGTVTISTAGAASATEAVLTNSASAVAASFSVAGQANASYSISITDNDLTHTDGVTTMALATKHDVDATTADSPASGTLDGTGAQTIYVGGTLTVAAAQAAGTYSGTITATVEYN